MSKLTRMAARAFNVVATVGILVTAYRVVPILWELEPIGCVVVVGALSLFALDTGRDAILGKW